MKEKKCTLLINSCDSYKDILDNFFKLLHKYWPDLEYDIVLSTESYDYKNKFFSIRNVHPENVGCSWTERIADALNKIDSEVVIFMLDDFFLYDYVDNKKVKECVRWIEENKKIVNFTIWPIYSDCLNCKYDGFEKRTKVSNYKVAAIASIWNRKQFLKYTEGYKENIWEWEVNATKRSNTKYKNDEFYITQGSQDDIIPYDFAKYGLFSGKWMEETKEIFEKNNIQYDFSKRGIYDQKQRAFSKSIIDAFTMESSLTACYNLKHKGSSVKKYNEKFKSGFFTQTYKISGAQNGFCWEPNVSWGFSIKGIKITVLYKDKEQEIIKNDSLFGNFLKIDEELVFNTPNPMVYVPTKKDKKIYIVIIEGNLIFPAEKKLLDQAYNKITEPNDEESKVLKNYINLENVISKEKCFYIKLNPEIRYVAKGKVIEHIKDKRKRRKGFFKYEYELPNNKVNIEKIMWSPSDFACYKLKNFKIIGIDDNNKKTKISNISGFPKDGIFLDKEWVCFVVDSNVKKIVISGNFVFPLKSSELRKYI